MSAAFRGILLAVVVILAIIGLWDFFGLISLNGRVLSGLAATNVLLFVVFLVTGPRRGNRS